MLTIVSKVLVDHDTMIMIVKKILLKSVKYFSMVYTIAKGTLSPVDQ
jgi:hypothetical protein